MRTLTFKIDGGDLTRLVRSVYADEQEPKKAISILEAAFPTMSKAQRLAILTGSKRLEGDEHGMELVEDDASETEAGCPLDLSQAVTWLRQERDDAVALMQDRLDLDEDDVAVVGSPEGAVIIPRRRRDAYLRNQISLDDMVCRRIGPTFSIAEEEEEEEKESSSTTTFPIVVKDKITQETGWLSPEGKFYPCSYMEHVALADALGYEEGQIEALGWIKLTLGYQPFPGDRPATQAQLDRLFDWLGCLPAWAQVD